ncbi:hypothetical protein ACTMU2_24245 [Cupriavidus basilensis]
MEGHRNTPPAPAPAPSQPAPASARPGTIGPAQRSRSATSISAMPEGRPLEAPSTAAAPTAADAHHRTGPEGSLRPRSRQPLTPNAPEARARSVAALPPREDSAAYRPHRSHRRALGTGAGPPARPAAPHRAATKPPRHQQTGERP